MNTTFLILGISAVLLASLYTVYFFKGAGGDQPHWEDSEEDMEKWTGI